MANKLESGQVKASPLQFALPVVEFTDYHVRGIIEHNLSALQISFLLFLLGNMDSDTGNIHQHRVSYLSKQLGCHPSQFYGTSGLIAVLNATGLVSLRMKNLKVCGKVIEPSKKRMKRKDEASHPYPLKFSMIHREALKCLIPRTASKTDMRFVLISALHCDLDTGALNTELRACQWADMIGVDRTSVERSVDRLTDWGIFQLKRDYVVSGCLNYTAMGHGFLKLSAEQKKAANAEAKENREKGLYDYKWIETQLCKFYGLNATGWMKRQLREAFDALVRPFLPKETSQPAASDPAETSVGSRRLSEVPVSVAMPTRS